MKQKVRSYKLLCPVARALDRIGDRWTLLILRDLHAGPARFSDLQRGLTGIAANLLTERLAKLVTDDLIAKEEGAHGAKLYRLTELGGKTRDILFDLALFGGQFSSESETVEPGNLRLIAVTFGTAAQRVVTDDMDFEASLIIDDEPFALTARQGKAEMLYQPAAKPDIILETTYHALLSLGDGEIDQDAFSQDHSRIDVKTPGKDAEFARLMSDVLALFSS